MIWLKDFTKLDADEILAVFRARTDPSVARFSKSNFSFETHRNFIKYLKYQDDKKYFMVYDDNDFIGVISFIEISAKDAEFGIYKNPSAAHVGNILMNEMLKFARDKLNIEQIHARALRENTKAIALYRKFGFEITSEDEKIIYLQKKLNEA